MNWEAIGAISEVVGAAGVIFTLIYLAMQHIIQGSVDHNRAIADNPELAALLNKSVDEPELLSNDVRPLTDTLFTPKISPRKKKCAYAR